MQNIRPWLWFKTQAEEAANFYVSTFKNSRIVDVARYGEEGPGPAGSVMLIRFTIDGLDVMAINAPGGDERYDSAMYVNVQGGQSEVDRLWEALAEGGETNVCGWLTDRFGVWWNIVPAEFETMVNDPDPEKRGRGMRAMMQMTKLDIAALQRAFDGTDQA
jgi:predicted 3-demethylubiquinone-9 3-methyltransferase (glyoxalase superfamily)